MPQMKGGKALVASVLQHGVDTIFGLPGGQIYEVFDALYDEPTSRSLPPVTKAVPATWRLAMPVRPDGVGVFSVVPGHGFLNATTALSTAYVCNSPVLCLAGQIPAHAIGRNIGYLHDIPDQLGVAQRVTKWAARVDHPAQAPQMVRDAFKQMTTGRADRYRWKCRWMSWRRTRK